MERRGDGVPIILDESRKLSGRDPSYRLIDSAVFDLLELRCEELASLPSSPRFF
jgi:hypothetical protein